MPTDQPYMTDPDDFWEEFKFSPETEDLYNVDVGPYGYAKPRSFGAGMGRLMRKTVADPARKMYRMVAEARRGKMPKPQDSLDFAMNMVATPGGEGGLGSGVRWKPFEKNFKFKSTDILESGRIGKKDLPVNATGDAWLNRLRQAGVPKTEMKYGGVEDLLERVGKDTISREDLVASIKLSPNYPTYGMRRIKLGYPHDIARQGSERLKFRHSVADKKFSKAFNKRAEELGHDPNEINTTVLRAVFSSNIAHNDPELMALVNNYRKIQDDVIASDPKLTELYNKAEDLKYAGERLKDIGGISHKHKYEQLPLG